MKKFIALSFIACIAMQAWACGGWVRPNYYMFSVFNRDMIENNYQKEANNFWKTYIGDDFGYYMLEDFGNVEPAEFDKSDHPFITAAKKKRDTEMLNYLRLLNQYVNNNGAGYNQWDYPSKEELAKSKTVIQDVKQKALAYKGKRLKDQYALLVMRCNMTAQEHQANVDFWNTTASRLKDTPYKQWMKNIYAGALYNTGEKDKAAQIFAEMGDMTSIKYCVRKKRNLKGIKEEYASNPNSPTLVFLVQDFVNNTQETLDNDSDPNIMQYVEATGIYQNDIDGFIDFAGQVLKEGKTKSPAMWEAARGFVNYMNNNQGDAIKQLTNAQNLAGTQRMKDNARACLLLASIKSSKPDDNFFNYVTGELQWLDKVGGITPTNKYGTDPHYGDVYDRVTYDALVPKLYTWGMPNAATAVLAMADAHSNGSDYAAVIDRVSSREYEEFHDYLTSGDKSSLEKMAIASVNLPQVAYDDRMGTKLLREGEFQAAIPYLEKVPLSHISEQGISYYMARKDYNQEIWLKRQFLSPWKEHETEAKLTENAKLTYCRDMVALDKQIASATGETRNQLLLKKANLLYQASFKGDCWYLTHYAQSANDEQQSNEYDFVNSARSLLREVELNTSDMDIKLKSIFAQTFVIGENSEYCVQKEFNYDTRTYENTLFFDTPHYRAMMRFDKFYQQSNLQVPYVSKCDIYKRFLALTK